MRQPGLRVGLGPPRAEIWGDNHPDAMRTQPWEARSDSWFRKRKAQRGRGKKARERSVLGRGDLLSTPHLLLAVSLVFRVTVNHSHP